MKQSRLLLSNLLQWALEDQALQGLGGPPNNWQSSPRYPSCQKGTASGRAWHSIRFGNDAFEMWIASQYTDEDESRYLLVIASEDFRSLALWYLWRWAWGDWFGLRRKLFYWRLHLHM